MKQLLQRVAAFLYHVIDAPETAPETREAARELSEDITDAINGNYREGDDEEE
ncbi:MAG: hypothetical protein KDB00_27705 [Planctomycetales bacterium]|nr:hypothetical protein [Planctomycetales bacterium]